MLLVWLAACSPDGSSAWANLVVTTTVRDSGGLLASQTVESYDEQGRRVSVVTTSSLGASEGRTVYEGDCAVRTSFTTTSNGVVTLSIEQAAECDEQGDPVRELVETTFEDGSVRTSTYTWENEHDAEGRLIRTDVHADGAPVRTEAYTWGECVDPVLARVEDLYGGIDERTVECRGDGQPTVEAVVRVEGFDGATVTIGSTNGYDILGHRVSRADWAGVEQEVTGTSRYTWRDPSAPGPTEGLAFQGDQLTSQWTISYE